MKKMDRKEFLAQLETDSPGPHSNSGSGISTLGAYSKEFEERYKNSLSNEKKINWTKVGTISTIILGIVTILLMTLL